MDDLVARAPVPASREARVHTEASMFQAIEEVLPRVQRLARLLTDNADDADDLVAEALARMLPRASTIDDPPAYLKRTVIHLASRRWTRRALAARRDHRALDWLPVGVDEAAEVVERDRTLRAIRGLPPRRRTIVVLRYYDDLPLDEIAGLLGISIGTVKSQLSRGLEQLRTALGGQNTR